MIMGEIWAKIVAFFMSVIAFFSGLFGGGAITGQDRFKNDYVIPESVAPYSRIGTAPKTDWTAKYIWDRSDGSEENVWMCFRKTADISAVSEDLTAYISADSKYWLYINGEPVVFEGGAKRGPAPDGS